MNFIENALKSQIPEPLIRVASALADIYENGEIKKKLEETGNTGVISVVSGNHLIQAIIYNLTDDQIAAINAAQEQIITDGGNTE